jgi:hypothetical protein
MDTSFKSDKSGHKTSSRSKKLPEGDFLAAMEQEIFKLAESNAAEIIQESSSEVTKEPAVEQPSSSPDKPENKFSSQTSYTDAAKMKESIEDSKYPEAYPTREYSVSNFTQQNSFASPELQDYTESQDLGKKTFLTQVKGAEDKGENFPWSLHDILFPGGKVAKLVRTN